MICRAVHERPLKGEAMLILLIVLGALLGFVIYTQIGLAIARLSFRVFKEQRRAPKLLAHILYPLSSLDETSFGVVNGNSNPFSLSDGCDLDENTKIPKLYETMTIISWPLRLVWNMFEGIVIYIPLLSYCTLSFLLRKSRVGTILTFMVYGPSRLIAKRKEQKLLAKDTHSPFWMGLPATPPPSSLGVQQETAATIAKEILRLDAEKADLETRIKNRIAALDTLTDGVVTPFRK